MNRAEAIVTEIATRSCLSFWTFPNPRRKDNGKELTDLLVVNDPFVIIVSVKEVKIKETGDASVDSMRWYKRAIKKSYNQLYGAERAISNNTTKVLTRDRKHLIQFPSVDKAVFYRLGISIGRREPFALPFGHFETGFVHFFDQESFPILLSELDTITDLTEYLAAKEAYFDIGKNVLFRSEEDLLAVYLHRGRKFPENLNLTVINEGVWDELRKKEEFRRRKEQEKNSYVWDRIIEEFFRDASADRILFDSDWSSVEQSLRAMSKESRFDRMVLSDAFLAFVGLHGEPKAHARIVRSRSGVAYVFLLDAHREDDRDARVRELRLRCLAARNINKDCAEVVGIATNAYKKGHGHSYDLCYISMQELTEDESRKISEMQNDLGYFVKPHTSEKHYEEYPLEHSSSKDSDQKKPTI